MTEDNVSLGGNIELSGFKDLDSGSMVIIKKIVGNYAKRFSQRIPNFERIRVIMKPVHEREHSEKYEIHAHLTVGGNPFIAEDTDRNLFFVLDNVLRRVEESASKA